MVTRSVSEDLCCPSLTRRVTKARRLKSKFVLFVDFNTLLSRDRAIPNCRELFHFVVRKRAIEDGDTADPRGKRRVSIAVDDATDRKRPALLN